MPLAAEQTPLETISVTLALLAYILGTLVVSRHLFLNHKNESTIPESTMPGARRSDRKTNTLNRSESQDSSIWPAFKRRIVAFGITAATLHLLSSISFMISLEGFDFGVFPLLSFVGALMVIGTLIISIQRPFENITVIVYPLAAILLLLPVIFDSSYLPRTELSTAIMLHIVLSLLAYSTLGIAFAQSLLLLGQNYQLKHKRLAGVIQVLPPLQLMETILFGLIWLGVILLTTAIATGLLFLDNIFAQQLAHKTFFTLCAWGTFATLLIGRYRAGWRGLTAVRWTISGFLVLLVGFVGTKVVLEIVLTP